MKTGKWLVAMVVSTIFSIVGAWIGKMMGGAFMTQFILSTIAGGFGLWYGAKWAKMYLGF